MGASRSSASGRYGSWVYLKKPEPAVRPPKSLALKSVKRFHNCKEKDREAIRPRKVPPL